MNAKLYHDNFQNYKKYGIPKAQLVIADIPYNIGANAYGSNPMRSWGGKHTALKLIGIFAVWQMKKCLRPRKMDKFLCWG